MGTAVGLLILSLLLSAHAAEQWILPPKIRSAVMSSRNMDIGRRMEVVSRPFIGLPYVLDPMGESFGVDPDPLIRYDAFDCLTYVEEVLALSLSFSPDSADINREQLRYFGGVIHYRTRKHFMLSQWIPDNLEKGFLRDITPELGEVEVVEKSLLPELWKKWKLRDKYKLADTDLPQGDFHLNVLPLNQSSVLLEKIPNGALLIVVRRDDRNNPLLVSHIGIVVEKGGRKWIRHATTLGKRIRQDRLDKYIAVMRRTRYKWPVVGFSVLFPLEQGPRHLHADEITE